MQGMIKADLELKLDQVDQGLNVNKCSKLQEERKLLKLRLDNLYKEKSKWYQIRATAKWVELGKQAVLAVVNWKRQGKVIIVLQA